MSRDLLYLSFPFNLMIHYRQRTARPSFVVLFVAFQSKWLVFTFLSERTEFPTPEGLLLALYSDLHFTLSTTHIFVSSPGSQISGFHIDATQLHAEKARRKVHSELQKCMTSCSRKRFHVTAKTPEKREFQSYVSKMRCFRFCLLVLAFIVLAKSQPVFIFLA